MAKHLASQRAKEDFRSVSTHMSASVNDPSSGRSCNDEYLQASPPAMPTRLHLRSRLKTLTKASLLKRHREESVSQCNSVWKLM